MNGLIVVLKNNLKSKLIKSVHKSMIIDLKYANFDEKNFVITTGKDNMLKLTKIQNEGEVKFYMQEDCNILTFESLSNGNIAYVKENNFNIKILKYEY